MNPAQIRRYLGLSVIVQFRDAMALGKVGDPRWAPVCNERGEVLKKDGTIADKTTEKKLIAKRPAWPITVRRDEAKAPEFRFAIENVMLSLSAEGTTVYVVYMEHEAAYELMVEPEAIVGITCVRAGPEPPPDEEEGSSLIRPGRN